MRPSKKSFILLLLLHSFRRSNQPQQHCQRCPPRAAARCLRLPLSLPPPPTQPFPLCSTRVSLQHTRACAPPPPRAHCPHLPAAAPRSRLSRLIPSRPAPHQPLPLLLLQILLTSPNKRLHSVLHFSSLFFSAPECFIMMPWRSTVRGTSAAFRPPESVLVSIFTFPSLYQVSGSPVPVPVLVLFHFSCPKSNGGATPRPTSLHYVPAGATHKRTYTPLPKSSLPSHFCPSSSFHADSQRLALSHLSSNGRTPAMMCNSFIVPLC